MLLIVGTIRIPVDRLADARPAMAAMMTASQAEDGCETYAYALDLLTPGLIHIIERWTDRAALDRHATSPHMAIWRAHWPELGIYDRNLTLYDVDVGKPI